MKDSKKELWKLVGIFVKVLDTHILMLKTDEMLKTPSCENPPTSTARTFNDASGQSRDKASLLILETKEV